MKTIQKHKAVETVKRGWDADSDYKYWVELKPGYVFKTYDTTCKGCNSVSDFRYANPQKKS